MIVKEFKFTFIHPILTTMSPKLRIVRTNFTTYLFLRTTEEVSSVLKHSSIKDHYKNFLIQWLRCFIECNIN